MDFNGEYHLTADRRTVWNALNDINVLREAIPGCEQFTETGSNKYTATINSKIGPVTAKFKTNITVDNIMPEQSYTLIVEGSGGAQ
ncbi:MAG: carbon monoxide dehydrogenase, partial [Gammaproteobacteria bacterium]|nr:carbon monoxide dehydrogenase [Gammaproteobacteria bacterium]NIO62820.1 carbon monoxide dehydrogenase [Gammaproteobacteria bacterium]